MKKEIHKNSKSIEKKESQKNIGIFFIKLRELIKIIFSIGEDRITWSKGFFLYILGIITIYGITRLIFAPFGIKISTTNNSYIGIVITVLYILYLWGYLLPKRAHDHGFPGYMGLIPIINVWFMRMPGDKYENKYGEKPSFWYSLKNRAPENWKREKDPLSGKVMLIIIGLIILIGLCVRLCSEGDKHLSSEKINTVIHTENME